MAITLKNKVILVTGGAGFIGSHLIEKLVKLGAKIIVADIAIHPTSYFAIQSLQTKVQYEICNVANITQCRRLFTKYNFDYIFHLAAQAIVQNAYDKPYDALRTNILGTVNILELTRISKTIKALIVASSDKAYGVANEKYTEQTALNGQHPYDASKASADLLTQTYVKTYAIPGIITRFGNVYGPGDVHLERIIPGICEAVALNKPLQIRSNGLYKRDYIFIDDVVDGYIFLLIHSNKTLGNAFNFSSADNISVVDLVHKAEKILQKKIQFAIHNSAKHEIPYQHLDDSKIRNLGWKTESVLEQSLPKTFLWYTTHMFGTLHEKETH